MVKSMVVYEQKLGIGLGIFISDRHTVVYLSVKSEEASLTNCKKTQFYARENQMVAACSWFNLPLVGNLQESQRLNQPSANLAASGVLFGGCSSQSIFGNGGIPWVQVE
jgi:hypothetical protein